MKPDTKAIRAAIKNIPICEDGKSKVTELVELIIGEKINQIGSELRFPMKLGLQFRQSGDDRLLFTLCNPPTNLVVLRATDAHGKHGNWRAPTAVADVDSIHRFEWAKIAGNTYSFTHAD